MKKLKKFKRLATDQEAIDEVATIDLTEYDFSDFVPVTYEFENKSAAVHFRLPESQLSRIKAEAKKRGKKYQPFMRELMERGLKTLTP